MPVIEGDGYWVPGGEKALTRVAVVFALLLLPLAALPELPTEEADEMCMPGL